MGREIVVELREELRRDERRCREHDAVCGDRLAVVQLDLEACRSARHAGSRSPEEKLGAREAGDERRHERAHPGPERDERRSLARRRDGQAAEQAPVLELEHAQLRKRRLERELLAVASVDPGHERLDEGVVGLAPEPARDERRNRLVPVAGGGRYIGLGREPRLPPVREKLTRLEGVEVRGDHPGEALGERVQRLTAPDERALVLGTAPDELLAEAELLAQADTALLAREEAVRRRLDDQPVDVLGAHLPARDLVALDELHVHVGRLEPTRRGEAGDSTADDDDPHAARTPGSHGSARSRTSCASWETKTGSSFSAGGRSSRIPRPAAISAAR